MCTIGMKTPSKRTTTEIPNRFIDEYMEDANGSYVKIYLYLLRCISDDSTEDIIGRLCRQLQYLEKDVIRALRYWADKGLLEYTLNEQGGIHSIILSDLRDVPAAADTISKTPKTAAPLFTEPDSEDMEFISITLEQYLNRPLTPADLDLIRFIYHDLKFPATLVLRLYEHCIELKKTSNAYIKKVAISWNEQHILTEDDANLKINNYKDGTRAIRKELGISADFGAAEMDYINKWYNDWHMSIPLVIESCRRTKLLTGKASFPYIDSILSNWHQNGITTTEQVKKLDSAYQQVKKGRAQEQANQQKNAARKPAGNKFHDFPQRDYTPEQWKEIELRMRGL